uniref:Uncharacterized protein n=1 Tax=Glossina pallidipes TaxID=7398 RepID=A0A1B0A0V5_GLOPL
MIHKSSLVFSMFTSGEKRSRDEQFHPALGFFTFNQCLSRANSYNKCMKYLQHTSKIQFNAADDLVLSFWCCLSCLLTTLLLITMTASRLRLERIKIAHAKTLLIRKLHLLLANRLEFAKSPSDAARLSYMHLEVLREEAFKNK